VVGGGLSSGWKRRRSSWGTLFSVGHRPQGRITLVCLAVLSGGARNLSGDPDFFPPKYPPDEPLHGTAWRKKYPISTTAKKTIRKGGGGGGRFAVSFLNVAGNGKGVDPGWGEGKTWERHLPRTEKKIQKLGERNSKQIDKGPENPCISSVYM